MRFRVRGHVLSLLLLPADLHRGRPPAAAASARHEPRLRLALQTLEGGVDASRVEAREEHDAGRAMRSGPDQRGDHAEVFRAATAQHRARLDDDGLDGVAAGPLESGTALAHTISRPFDLGRNCPRHDAHPNTAGPANRRRADHRQYMPRIAAVSTMVHSTSSFGGSAKTTVMTTTHAMAIRLTAPPARPSVHGAVKGVVCSPRPRRRLRQLR